MAKVSFRSADGEEESCKLVQHRPTRIGRDPGNDVVLRDAKVSRAHAEVVFEKGFFVLHDLASANGTWVNGKRVRVAPLIEGAEIRVGNTTLVFSEELPDGPHPTVAAPLPPEAELAPDENFMPVTEPLPPPLTEEAPPPPTRREPAPIAPVPMEDQISDVRNTQPARPVIRTTDRGATEVEPMEAIRSAQRKSEWFHQNHYVIELPPPGELGTIRGAGSQPLLYFKRNSSLVGLVAGVLAAMVAISGIAASLFLTIEQRFLPAAGALALTLVFAMLLVSLVPKRHLALYRNENLTGKALTIMQERRLAFPTSRFSVRSEEGKSLAFFEKNALRGLGFAKTRWWIIDGTSSAALGFSTVHRSGGRPQAAITVGVRPAGTVSQQPEDAFATLDLSSDAMFTLDRRIALAAAILSLRLLH